MVGSSKTAVEGVGGLFSRYGGQSSSKRVSRYFGQKVCMEDHNNSFWEVLAFGTLEEKELYYG